MTKISHFLRIPVLFLLIVCGVAWIIGNAGPQQQSNSRTYSPHGTLKTPCEDCHTTGSWKPIRSSPDFKHNTTRYPLQGMHKNLGCKECHADMVFSHTGSQCADCHADIHRRLMGSDCERCHSVLGWLRIKTKTNGHENRFPLSGAHAAVQCEGCHKNAAVGVYLGLSTDCVSCHLNDFRSAKTPDHQASGFSQKCETCHRTDNWFTGFDHSRFTGFALVGAHARLDCAQCHAGGRFAGTPTACIGCHLQDYNGATSPDHRAGSFPQDCTQCHTQNAWTPASFNHNLTPFPLTGAHTTVPCNNCHIGGVFAGTPTDCYSCHTKDFTGVTDPNHVTGNFPHTCQTCHSTNAWTPATFDHSTTPFPLTGAHTTVPCANCHANGKFAGTPTDCYSCHTNDYNGVSNPNHVTGQYPHDCTMCHSTTAWSPSTFNHQSTPFPLTGTHVTTPCASCHINGIFAGTPTDCYSCHSSEYNTTTNPNHIASAFPKTCADCHSTTLWSGAVFNHTGFPIYSGTHANRWTTCADCHPNSSDYAVFTCTTACHPQANTNSQHQGVANYVYASPNCYACHPTGRSD